MAGNGRGQPLAVRRILLKWAVYQKLLVHLWVPASRGTVKKQVGSSITSYFTAIGSHLPRESANLAVGSLCFLHLPSRCLCTECLPRLVFVSLPLRCYIILECHDYFNGLRVGENPHRFRPHPHVPRMPRILYPRPPGSTTTTCAALSHLISPSSLASGKLSLLLQPLKWSVRPAA